MTERVLFIAILHLFDSNLDGSQEGIYSEASLREVCYLIWY